MLSTTPKDNNILSTASFQQSEEHFRTESYSSTIDRLKLKKTTRKAKCKDKHCGRPFTWMTTVKGETRDFFRILNIM